MVNEQVRSWEDCPESIKKLATTLNHARANNYQISPISKYNPDFDQKKGYEIAAAIRALRECEHGHSVAGQKIGFTNRNIWPEYGIDCSNWSYMYRNTVLDLTQHTKASDRAAVDIRHLSNLEPKIEPEIALGIAKPIQSSMSDAQLLECVAWMAHSFEVVASIFPGWRFAAADTTAGFALHSLLLVGPKRSLGTFRASSNTVLNHLATFSIDLYRNDIKIDSGKGSNVLGSRIKALRHLAELLEKDEFNPPLAAGEVVTTGTLTRALDIRHGDVWSTKLGGIDFPGLDVDFTMQ